MMLKETSPRNISMIFFYMSYVSFGIDLVVIHSTTADSIAGRAGMTIH